MTIIRTWDIPITYTYGRIMIYNFKPRIVVLVQQRTKQYFTKPQLHWDLFFFFDNFERSFLILVYIGVVWN